MSKVMANGNDRIKFPINEPAAGQEEVADRRVPRVLSGPRRAAHRPRHRRHHRARVTALRDRGVEFLQVPTTYYDELQDRVGKIDEAARRARGARHPRRPRPRRLPAADLHASRSRTGRRCSTRSSSGRARGASARATSRRCSRRSSASRRCGGICRRASDGSCDGHDLIHMPIYHTLGKIPRQAAHRLPASPTAGSTPRS